MHDEDAAELKAAPPNQRDELKRSFEGMASWPEGIAVLRHIHKLSGYDQKLMRFDPNTSELNDKASLYNLSKRDVWLSVRELLSPKTLAKIENYQEE